MSRRAFISDPGMTQPMGTIIAGARIAVAMCR
jgi:hypothetical protein